MISEYKRNVSCLSTFFVAFFILSAVVSAEPKITASSDIKSKSIISDAESHALSLASGKVLQHAEAARLAILDKNKKSAIEEISQGLKLVQIIDNAAPKYQVLTDIKSGDIAYHQDKEVAQRYISIFDEQYVDNIVIPVVQAKVDSASSKLTSKSDKKKDVYNSTEFDDLSVWQHTSMKLDVVWAKRMLEEAKKALTGGKNETAIAALLSIQTRGVSFSMELEELPLAEAANNLKLAELEMKQGKYKASLETLKLASDDLKKYEEISGESRSKEVRELHQEIDKLTRTLDQEKNLMNAMKKVEQQILSWWERAAGWLKK